VAYFKTLYCHLFGDTYKTMKEAVRT